MVLGRIGSVRPQRKKSKISLKAAAALLGAACLAGCGGAAVKQTFDLSAPAAGAGQTVRAPHRKAQISVSVPGALKPLDGQDMVIRGGGGSIAYLQGAQWSDRLTDMVQMRLIQALDDSHCFSGVARLRDGINADYQLMTDLRAFSVDLDAQGRFANVEISAKIMDNKNSTIRKMRVFSAMRRVNGSGNANYAAALDAAFAAVLQEIVNWTARSL